MAKNKLPRLSEKKLSQLNLRDNIRKAIICLEKNGARKFRLILKDTDNRAVMIDVPFSGLGAGTQEMKLVMDYIKLLADEAEYQRKVAEAEAKKVSKSPEEGK